MTLDSAETRGRLFVDALARVGARGAKHEALPWRLDQLLDEMEHCSISGALVWSVMSERYDARFGNRELAAELQNYPNLWPGWNVLPHQTEEFSPPEDLRRDMIDAGVRAVSVCPRTNAWNLLGSHVRPLFEMLTAERIPCFLHRSELDSWRQLEEFLKLHPDLSVVLAGASWSEQRLLIPLLLEFHQLHFTGELLQMNRGLEDLERWGVSDRFLFGTNAPAMSLGAHRCGIDYSAASEEARDAAAGGNLLRLLRKDPPRGVVNASDDVLMQAAKAGRPLPISAIDAHMHILHEGCNGGGWHFRMSKGGPSGVFDQLGRLGVAGGGFMSWNGTVGGDSIAGNACVQAALDAAPQGYWGLATFDPCQYSHGELSRMIPAFYESDRRFIGMKPYFVYGVEYHHPSYDPWWNYGNEHALYAGLHRVRGDYQEVHALAARYPRVRWVVYHCGSDYKAADGVIECIKQYPNVYAEITYTSVTAGVIDYLVENAGDTRVLYGSDLPMRDPAPQLGWVVFSRLPLDQKIRILRDNALDLIAPCRQRLPAWNIPGVRKEGPPGAMSGGL